MSLLLSLQVLPLKPQPLNGARQVLNTTLASSSNLNLGSAVVKAGQELPSALLDGYARIATLTTARFVN